jgi:hypothetical protein
MLGRHPSGVAVLLTSQLESGKSGESLNRAPIRVGYAAWQNGYTHAEENLHGAKTGAPL